MKFKSVKAYFTLLSFCSGTIASLGFFLFYLANKNEIAVNERIVKQSMDRCFLKKIYVVTKKKEN